MWPNFGRDYFCIPEKGATLARDIWMLDSERSFQINAIAYGLLEAVQWSPLEENWRKWFRGQFGLVFHLDIPPENSYFTLERELWTAIYDMMDDGVWPDYDQCWMLRFPASQGGAWPILWP
jgi:hypothetical protein